MDINALNIGENRQILQFSGYSYQEMKNDLHIYQRIFEDIVQINTIGRTIDGREIFHLRIGAANARNQILLFAESTFTFCMDNHSCIWPACQNLD